jgi:hypothetical protein
LSPNKTKNVTRLAGICALAAVIAACGGGGGSADPVAAPTPTPAPPNSGPPPTATNTDLVTNVQPATYAVGTAEKGAWDLLLSQRSACGFGLLNQDTRLDIASAAHANYLSQNTIDNPGTVFTGHFEDPARPYFFGVAPWDRAAAAGFQDSVTEIFSQVQRIYSTSAPAPIAADEAMGSETMRGLIHTVYHLSGAMWAGRSGGIGSVNKTGVFSDTRTQNMFMIDALVSNESDANKQRLGSGVVASYPCDGLTGVGTTFIPAQESPNPFPEITSVAVTYGTPVYFKSDAGSTLTIASAQITNATDGTVQPHRTINQSTDQAGHIKSNEYFVVPTVALKSGTRYSVTATGVLDGTAFTKTFTFQTR